MGRKFAYLSRAIDNPILSNTVWRDESNSVVAIYGPATNPSVDYGYVPSGGVLVKAKSAELTSDIPTDPTFVAQCNDGVTAWPPASFADLVGMPGSDDFSGVGCNSGVIDDKWGLRWNSIATAPTIQSGSMRFATAVGSSAWVVNKAAFSGGFDWTVPYNILVGESGAGTSSLASLILDVGGVTYEFNRNDSVAQAGQNIGVYYAGSFKAILATSGAAGTLRITSDGVTLTFFLGAVQVHQVAQSGVVANTSIRSASANRALQVDYGSSDIVNNTGNLIYIPIAGQSCT